MSLLKGSLPFGFKMLSLLPPSVTFLAEMNVIRKESSMGGKTRKQKEMEVLEINFPLETILFPYYYFLIRYLIKIIALLSIFF